MSWIDRLGSSVILISPNGREFEAKWRGSDRSKAKKVGLFSPPDKVGTVVQDLDVDANKYPMTIYFDGPDHDLTASLFYNTCDEKGTWQVTHPVHGKLNLQLISVTERNQPVTNGNYTQVDLDWIEPIDEDQLISAALIASQIEAQIELLNAQAADQLANLADQNSTFSVQSLKNALSEAGDLIKDGLASITAFNADIARIVNNVQRALNAALNLPFVAIASTASQIQILSQTPALATSSIRERISTYENLGNKYLGIVPEEKSLSGRNEVAVKELVLTSVLTTMPNIFITGEIQTRAEAFEYAESLLDYFATVTDDLDETQEFFEGSNIDIAYYSQSESFNDMAKLISLAIQYLLRASFNLKVEKRFTLKQDRAPIEISISEYGDENIDQNLDLFISSNNLKGDDILLLRAGREVVVYV